MTGAPGLAAGRPVLAIGLMSGTSLDGVDAALIESDGETIAAVGPSLTVPYPSHLREAIRAVLGAGADGGAVGRAERMMTDLHAEAVAALLDMAGVRAEAVRAIGFHGHTVWHRPAERVTRQIGDGARLALATRIDVVCDFRSADVAAGGQGAPLVPLYHAARALGDRRIRLPAAILNIGGVANLTWIGSDGRLIAFDTGPGNAPVDDWIRRHTGAAFDHDGAMAASGTVDRAALDRLLAHPYFAAPAPKSLDRLDFAIADLALPPDVGAATLTRFIAESVGRALRLLPAPPWRWLVTGGGRHNNALMAALADVLDAPVTAVERVGWNGDSLEAEAFAFLALRALRGLPLSLPETTGVPRPMPGGVVHQGRDGRAA